MNGGPQLRGWHVLAAVLAFFGVVTAVNVAFAIYAVRSFPGEDVRRSYLQGLQYNDTLAERRAQAALGWRVSTRFYDDAGEAGLEVQLATREGAPVNGAAVVGELQRPTSSQFDRQLTFAAAGEGRYLARLPSLESGRWRLRAKAESATGGLDFESELTWLP